VRAGVPEKLATLISERKNRNVFERYNISNDRDVRAAALSLDAAREHEHEAAKHAEATLGTSGPVWEESSVKPSLPTSPMTG